MTLTQKIARLVAARGWNQDRFARSAGLNRNTARQILLNPDKRLRNQTVRQIADALDIPVHELTELPLQELLERQRNGSTVRRMEFAAQPELQAWLGEHAERARQLSADEIDELLSLQGTGGPLTVQGVEHFVRLIERKRALKAKVETIAGTDYLEVLEKLVELMYEKIQPYRKR